MGIPKKIDYYPYDNMRYKVKGEHFFRKDQITDFHDTSIYFTEDFHVCFNEIKTVHFRSDNYHAKLFQRLFLIAGIGYFSLYVINGALLSYNPILTNKAIIISASFLLASFTIKQLRTKRVKINKNGFLRVIDIDYNHLNTP